MTGHTIGIVGGTGPQGMGLAMRLSGAGNAVRIGSRDVARAEEAARSLDERRASHRGRDMCSHGGVQGVGNPEAVAKSDIVVLATPWDPSRQAYSWMSSLVGVKIVVSCINPLGFDKRGPYGLSVDAGSAAEHIATVLPTARVVGAFHHLAAPRLLEPGVPLDEEDILVASDDEDAAAAIAELSSGVSGAPGVIVGPLRLCRQLEQMTAVLISVNLRYRTHAGLALRNVAR